MPQNGSKNLLPYHFRKGQEHDSDALKAGWSKKLRGRNLLKAILESKHLGDPVLKANAAAYFGVSADEITNEAMMYMIQVTKAINKNDTFAFETIMARTFGKIKEYKDEEEVEKAPVINIQPVASVADLEVAENEEQIDFNRIDPDELKTIE